MSKKLMLWLPPLIWMGVIFFFSSLPRVSITEDTLKALIFFKSLHVIEYGILYLLLFRPFYSLRNKQIPIYYVFLFALIVGVIYALSDEIHQIFIPTREGKMRDVLIDTGGMLLMYIYIRYNLSKLKKFLI